MWWLRRTPALQEFEAIDSQAGVKKNVKAAIERVAARLGNTPTICRKCYVHPEILGCYAQGELLLRIKREADAERQDPTALTPEEAAVLALLEKRLARTLEDQLKESLKRGVRRSRSRPEIRSQPTRSQPTTSG